MQKHMLNTGRLQKFGSSEADALSPSNGASCDRMDFDGWLAMAFVMLCQLGNAKASNQRAMV